MVKDKGNKMSQIVYYKSKNNVLLLYNASWNFYLKKNPQVVSAVSAMVLFWWYVRAFRKVVTTEETGIQNARDVGLSDR